MVTVSFDKVVREDGGRRHFAVPAIKNFIRLVMNVTELQLENNKHNSVDIAR